MRLVIGCLLVFAGAAICTAQKPLGDPRSTEPASRLETSLSKAGPALFSVSSVTFDTNKGKSDQPNLLHASKNEIHFLAREENIVQQSRLKGAKRSRLRNNWRSANYDRDWLNFIGVGF